MSQVSPDKSQIDTLTALRFFAAAWVVMFHYWPALGGGGLTPALVQKGYLGVELFFVLSGFVISYVYQEAVEQGRFRYRDFLWARLARIYPLHLLTLAAVALMGAAALAAGVAVGTEVLDLGALPANLLLVQAWGLSPSASFNHPSWSISAEWFAYLTFPAFAAAAGALRNRPGVAVAGALFAVLALYAGFESLTGFPLTQATIHWGALRIVPCFALGCAVHLVWRAGALRRGREALISVAVSLGAILLLADIGAPDALLTACFGSLILSLAALWRNGKTRTPKALTYLGEISFSTYMICVPWKLLVTNAAALLGQDPAGLPPVIWILVLAAPLIPLSALSYELVERPARTWLKRHAPGRAGGATLQPAV